MPKKRMIKIIETMILVLIGRAVFMGVVNFSRMRGDEI